MAFQRLENIIVRHMTINVFGNCISVRNRDSDISLLEPCLRNCRGHTKPVSYSENRSCEKEEEQPVLYDLWRPYYKTPDKRLSVCFFKSSFCLYEKFKIRMKNRLESKSLIGRLIV